MPRVPAHRSGVLSGESRTFVSARLPRSGTRLHRCARGRAGAAGNRGRLSAIRGRSRRRPPHADHVRMPVGLQPAPGALDGPRTHRAEAAPRVRTHPDDVRRPAPDLLVDALRHVRRLHVIAVPPRRAAVRQRLPDGVLRPGSGLRTVRPPAGQPVRPIAPGLPGIAPATEPAQLLQAAVAAPARHVIRRVPEKVDMADDPRSKRGRLPGARKTMAGAEIHPPRDPRRIRPPGV